MSSDDELRMPVLSDWANKVLEANSPRKRGPPAGDPADQSSHDLDHGGGQGFSIHRFTDTRGDNHNYKSDILTLHTAVTSPVYTPEAVSKVPPARTASQPQLPSLEPSVHERKRKLLFDTHSIGAAKRKPEDMENRTPGLDKLPDVSRPMLDLGSRSLRSKSDDSQESLAERRTSGNAYCLGANASIDLSRSPQGSKGGRAQSLGELEFARESEKLEQERRERDKIRVERDRKIQEEQLRRERERLNNIQLEVRDRESKRVQERPPSTRLSERQEPKSMALELKRAAVPAAATSWIDQERADNQGIDIEALGTRDRERNRERERERERGSDDQFKQERSDYYNGSAINYIPQRPAPQAPVVARKKGQIIVNNKAYQRLEIIGKGGSSKVYKVRADVPGSRSSSSSHGGAHNLVYAIKRVTFDEVDESIKKGFRGEIDLLKRLRNEPRVVQLIDCEIMGDAVYLVMECGEIDLAHVLDARLQAGVPLDVSFLRYYGTEMFKCLEAVHKMEIVHSDLKPANFLLVKGMLKIIDFGIANLVPEYTANIHRDMQIGTPNYMAPEALLDVSHLSGSQMRGNGPAAAARQQQQQFKFKIGKPSDVWSCGCILYQIVYGQPPYAHYRGSQRLVAIMNPTVAINYPRNGIGSVRVPREALELIQGCLNREPPRRWTVGDALQSSFVNAHTVDQRFIRSLVNHAVKYGAEKGPLVDRAKVDELASGVWQSIGSDDK